MRFDNLYDASSAKASSLKIEDDYRRKFLPVSNLFSFDPTANINLQRKLLNSEVKTILNKKKKELKKWKSPPLGMNLKVHSHRLYTQLYDFYPESGMLVVPYEIIIYDTNSGIEFKIQEKYPDLVQWNLQLMSIEALKRYYGMIKELLGGLNKEDFKDILFHFFDNRYFFPNKSFKPWIWYDVRTLDIKPFPIKGVQDYPGIIVKGYMFFWGDLWLEKYIRDSLIEKESGFGFRNFLITPYNIPPIFFTYPNKTLVTDWMLEKIGNLIKEEDNIVSNIFKTQLGVNTFKDIKISVSKVGIKDIKITFEDVFYLPNEKNWGTKTQTKLKDFSKYLPNKKINIKMTRNHGRVI
jgi:hypothetical protein